MVSWGRFSFLDLGSDETIRLSRRGNRSPTTFPERFQAKWKPVRVKKTRQIKNLEPRFDSIETEKALAGLGMMFASIADANVLALER